VLGVKSCVVPSKRTKQGFGLSYNQKLGVLMLWWVRCGSILHPSFSLVLGLVLRERIKSKEQGVKIANLNWIYLIL